MSKLSLRLRLIGAALAILIALALTSTIVASRPPDPAPIPTSTPAIPEGGGALIGRWPPGPTDANPVPGATSTPGIPLALGLLRPGGAIAEQREVRAMFDAAQRLTRVDHSVESEDAEPGEPAGAKGLVIDLRSGDEGSGNLDLLADLRRSDLLGGERAGGSSPVIALGMLGTTQLLLNPGFETGSWAPWEYASGGSVQPSLTTASPHAGTWSAHMGNELGTVQGDTCYRDVDQIFQQIVVPSGSLDAVSIEYWYRIETAETYVGEYDYLDAVLWDSGGNLVYRDRKDIAVVGNVGWTKATWTLTQGQRDFIAGKTMYFGFAVGNDCSLLSRVWVDDTALTVTTGTSPTPAPGPTECVTLLRNPTMDVVEFGDGTGTIDYWMILRQSVYFDNDPGYYQSPSYSLAMADETAASGADTDVVSSTLDLDTFAQGFVAPANTTALTVTYSRLYTNTNAGDEAYSILWTLTSDGYLDQSIEMLPVGETPEGWGSRYWDLTQPDDAAVLASLSGKPLAIMFALFGDRVPPSEVIWLDDIQVTACYQRAAGTVYLPAVLRTLQTVTGPTCVDLEPDGVAARGSTDLGAVCNGSFGAVDQRDYYSLDRPAAVTQVRLSLYDLPAGTNWDALIYEDASGYPLVCQIGTPGSGDKLKDCTLNAAKSYFVMVNSGVQPAEGQNTYHMSVTQR